MKIGTRYLVASLITVLALTLSFFYYSSGYRSAFEADQACHFDTIHYLNEEIKLYCDHDTETRQWLLYQKEAPVEKATVVKRYRY